MIRVIIILLLIILIVMVAYLVIAQNRKIRNEWAKELFEKNIEEVAKRVKKQ